MPIPLHPALCFALLGAAGVDEDEPLGSECTLVSSLPWGTASFCVQRAADIQPCIPENEVLRYHFLARSCVPKTGMLLRARSVTVWENRTDTSHLW